jgi:hypothetical protein
MRAYKYLYYRIYSWNLRKWGESDLPQFSALFFVLIFVFLNLMCIPTAIDLFTGGHLIKDSSTNKFLLGVIGFAIALFSYYVLVHSENYKKIALEFVAESARQKTARLIFIWLYLIGSFVLFLYSISSERCQVGRNRETGKTGVRPSIFDSRSS